MASCKFEGGKYKGGSEVKAHLRHNDISAEKRAIAKKKNKHIDLAKCRYNFSILGLGYQERCRKYDARIEYLDSHGNTNKRKDRVTMQCIEIPVPKDLPRGCYHDWFIRVAGILRAKYGEENFIDADIHYDEEHEYRDSATKELTVSRVHGHYMFVPEVNGKLNAKQISLRRNMKALNREVEEMTQQEFGCSFMTGEKKKSYKKVEELKQESENAELLFQIEQKQKEQDARRTAQDAREADLNTKDEELQAKEEELIKTQNTLSEWQESLETREASVRCLERQKKELLLEKEAVSREKSALEAAVRAVSEMPQMDGLVKTVIRRAVVDVPVSSTSKITAQIPALDYLERLRKSQRKRAEWAIESAGYADTDILRKKQGGTDFQPGL